MAESNLTALVYLVEDEPYVGTVEDLADGRA